MIFFTRALFGLRRELFPLEEWIEKSDREAAIDPDLPIIDAHHHLFDARTHDKGWPVSSLMITILYKLHPRLLTKLMCKTQDDAIIRTFSTMLPAVVPYMENGMLRDIENVHDQGDWPISQKEMEGDDSLPAHNIVGTVYIESGWLDPSAKSVAMEAVPEVAMAYQVAQSTGNRLCAGIVGHVPLSEGADAVRPALQAMIDDNPNFCGVRDQLAFREGLYPLTNASERKAYDEKFRSGFSVLGELSLTYDTWLYTDNVPALRDLALTFPDTVIICDHVGGPMGIPPSDPQNALETWKPVIKDLAASCLNVNVKLSGLGMPTAGFGFENGAKPATSRELANAWKPYILHCIECFGVERCMFASNFPMDKVSCGYTQLFNAFKIIVQDFSAEDKKKLFHDNAARIYGLKV